MQPLLSSLCKVSASAWETSWVAELLDMVPRRPPHGNPLSAPWQSDSGGRPGPELACPASCPSVVHGWRDRTVADCPGWGGPAIILRPHPSYHLGIVVSFLL